MSRMSGLVIDQIKTPVRCLELGVSHGREDGKVRKERDEPFRLAGCRPRPADRDVCGRMVATPGRATLTGPRPALAAWSKVPWETDCGFFFLVSSFPLSSPHRGPPGWDVSGYIARQSVHNRLDYCRADYRVV